MTEAPDTGGVELLCISRFQNIFGMEGPLHARDWSSHVAIGHSCCHAAPPHTQHSCRAEVQACMAQIPSVGGRTVRS